jgi:hypothetical protein
MQWPDVVCSPGYLCDRQNAFYWQVRGPPGLAKARRTARRPMAPALRARTSAAGVVAPRKLRRRPRRGRRAPPHACAPGAAANRRPRARRARPAGVPLPFPDPAPAPIPAPDPHTATAVHQ